MNDYFIILIEMFDMFEWYVEGGVVIMIKVRVNFVIGMSKVK